MKSRITPDEEGWIEAWPSRLTPLVDLICVPGAGAGASVYRPWRSKLAGFIAMQVCQLPGRENRIDHQSASDLSEVVEQIATAYLEQRSTARPVILFGHSMGGVIVYELARLLQQREIFPYAVLLSASTPPLPGTTSTPIDDDALKQMLVAYDPDNRTMINNEELFRSLAPILQSDFQMLRRHELDPTFRLSNVGAHLLSGDRDSVVPHGRVEKWKSRFSGEAFVQELRGGHQFPFREAQEEIVALLNKLARKALESVNA